MVRMQISTYTRMSIQFHHNIRAFDSSPIINKLAKPQNLRCHSFLHERRHRQRNNQITACANSQHSREPIALDVEYAHLLVPGGIETSVAAWVCLMAPYSSAPLLKTYCRHPILMDQGSAGSEPQQSVGGVRMGTLTDAPSLAEVANQILTLSEGHILVGHGLAKDLRALGIDREVKLRCDCYDTMQFRGFQSKGGNARSLRRLAKELLGQEIQSLGQLHDPEIDARAVLQLYMLHARPKLLPLYDDLVEHYRQQFLFGLKEGLNIDQTSHEEQEGTTGSPGRTCDIE